MAAKLVEWGRDVEVRRVTAELKADRFQARILNGATFPCLSTLSVLATLPPSLREQLPAGCFGGGCGVCRVRVISGDYRLGRMSRSRVSVEEERSGIALACQLFPLSDLVLERASQQAARATRPRSDGVQRKGEA